MTKVEKAFWQKWYDENKLGWMSDGEVFAVHLSADVEHDGGYGECDYGIDASLNFSVKTGEDTVSRWNYVAFDVEDMVNLVDSALEFGEASGLASKTDVG